MEITSANFEANLPLIQESIETCEFISIDTEFSGLSISMDDKPHNYETVEERYLKTKYIVTKFLAFQIGICTFHWNQQEKRYYCRPFSFYVFPKSKIQDSTVLIQSSAINFLTKNHFDFNKLFSKPLSFCQLSRIDEIENLCKQKANRTLSSSRFISQLSEPNTKRLEQILEEIDEWVYDSNSSQLKYYQIDSLSLRKALSKEVTKRFIKKGVFVDYERFSPKTIIRKSKNFKQRMFIKGLGLITDTQDLSQAVLGFQDEEESEPRNNDDITHLSNTIGISDTQINTCVTNNKKNGNNQKSNKRKEREQPSDVILIEEEKQQQGSGEQASQYTQTQQYTQYDDGPRTEEQINEEYQRLCNEEVGFTRVIGTMVKSKKPIVGHNLMFDICFIYNQFCGDLPDSFKDFYTLWKLFFPETYDTKVLAESTTLFPKSELQNVYRKCQCDKKLNNNLDIKFDVKADSSFGVYQIFEENASQSQVVDKGHDAGFDAYMTGYSFLTVAKYIEIGKILQVSEDIKMSQSQQAIKDDMKAGKSRSKGGSVTPIKKSASKTNGKVQPAQNKDEYNGKRGGKKTPLRKDSQIEINLDDLLSDYDNGIHKGVKTSNERNGKKSAVRSKVKESGNQIQQIKLDKQCSSPQQKRVKHYFQVQNKPVFYSDLKEWVNKVNMNKEVPRYFPLDGKLTNAEVEYEKRLQEEVLYLEFKEGITMTELAKIFSFYGDVNVVKYTQNRGYVEFTFIDPAKIKDGKLSSVVNEVKKQMKTKLKNVILKIDTYSNAIRFTDHKQSNIVQSTEKDI